MSFLLSETKEEAVGLRATTLIQASCFPVYHGGYLAPLCPVCVGTSSKHKSLIQL